MDNAVIDIRNVNKRYGAKDVLKDLTLTVPRGSVFGLLGKNGAGKTTLIKCVLGLLNTQAGQIRVLDDNPRDFQEKTKEQLGYVPQSDRVYPWFKVGQLLEYTGSFYPRWNRGLVDRLVREWELDPRQKVGLLSEGEAQKLSIILSLGHEPELLVFDEPVASLDPAARRQFLKTILEIVSNRECTVFFSTHITSDLERVADRVALLKSGQIDFCGGLDELKDEVKRLRVRAAGPVPKELKINGLLHYEASGNEAILCVRDFSPGTKGYFENAWKAEVRVEDLNLEEIFLELNR
ncbi:MAG: ABC transporter ATP-binding protein [Candidatus Omnitrophota bacterium]|nr:ABC transporter ATP-binding protein [Candidatus Omnitrophota bacterium]MDZ4242506.1 ABC transporter ATP-binding protein [Candidatus Omnitrophota bacterium]